MSTDVKPTDKISALKGIGPQKERIFNDNGIFTVEDLIYLFPRSYEDRRTVTPIAKLETGKEAMVVAKVVSKKTNMFSRTSPLSLMIEDESGMAEVVFFRGKFLDKLFDVGSEYVFYGKPGT